MTEKEKRDNQELYDANYDKEILQERTYIKDLCFEYNNLKPSVILKRDELIKKIFGKTGKNILVEPSFWCDYGYNIIVGENFYSNHNCVILDAAKVEFGDNVFIAPNCGFYLYSRTSNRCKFKK